jgi:recombinational DNA repair protein RecR
MNKIEKANKIDKLERELHLLKSRPTNCKTCKNYDQLGSCELFPQEKIPNDIIEQGCDSWIDDGVPF